MTRQRRAHNKSRAGCAQCKERHTRCDELHPRCRNCERLEIQCSFSSPTVATIPMDEDTLADFELLDYWYSHSLIPGAVERDRALKHAYVRLGFSYPYLLNSILGLTSLRRFDEDRCCTRWYIRAVAHQQAAISRSRPHFQPLDSSHHKAILAFATLTSLYAVAEPLRRPASFYHDRPELDPTQEFVHAVRLSRGSTAFVQQHLLSATASDPFMATKYSSDQLALTYDSGERFPQLLALSNTVQGIKNCEHQLACLDAVKRLFTCMAILVDNQNSGNTNHIMVIFAWIKEVDSTFWDMCSSRHPGALVILGHFAALMSQSQGFWLLQHWPSILLRHIREQVQDHHWRDLLLWPTSLVFHTNSAPRSS